MERGFGLAGPLAENKSDRTSVRSLGEFLELANPKLTVRPHTSRASRYFFVFFLAFFFFVAMIVILGVCGEPTARLVQSQAFNLGP
jgi:hypothetical protein